jgi:hypothetical protein
MVPSHTRLFYKARHTAVWMPVTLLSVRTFVHIWVPGPGCREATRDPGGGPGWKRDDCGLPPGSDVPITNPCSGHR